MIDQKFEELFGRLLESRDWFETQKNRQECCEYLVATGKFVKEVVDGELCYRALETEKRVVLKEDFRVMRAIRQLEAERKKVALKPRPVAGAVVDFRRRALERRLREAAHDNEKGLMMCEWLILAKLSPREQEFVTSLRQQILVRPQSFELSEKQARWLGDIWKRKAGAAQSN